MKDNQAKYPQLRFKGFTDPWEKRKLGDIAPLRGGFAFKSSKFRNTGVPIVRISNILSSGEVGGDFAYYDEQDKDDKYILPDKSAVLAMSGATTGKVSILSQTDYDKVYQNQRVGYFQSVDYIDYGFISTIVRSELFMMQLESVLVSGAQPNVSSKEIDSFNFMIPILVQEQQKIGSFFKQLDENIALHQRKLAKLKELKQGYLQKLFPKNGSKFPQLRFAGFADAWEQRKTKELCDISTGKGNTQDKVEDGKYPFYVRSATIERSNEYLYDQEAVLTVGDGVGTGKVFHYVNGKYNLHQRVYRMFNFNHGVSAKYFYHYFSKNFYRRVMSMTAKTSVDSVRMEMIADMKIKFPSPAEQETIVSVLDGVDDTITLHQRKLENSKNLKKGIYKRCFAELNLIKFRIL